MQKIQVWQDESELTPSVKNETIPKIDTITAVTDNSMSISTYEVIQKMGNPCVYYKLIDDNYIDNDVVCAVEIQDKLGDNIKNDK